ncbi:DUF4160 domain-containing protein [Pseudaestuariivita atlantica]|uniref:DUF4160 domain-containing protein n=1 Tax=Pseudaestuariivita atlantica TaxID=1317121 RepID=A0A0L1JTW9_9RHOB|nr:DUF4160 domain-containing protein [Pseudaestuariivita atlantica]KNG95195.1 hypothetical protein ATO11_00690 [Pseudaestuariivita atlantica]
MPTVFRHDGFRFFFYSNEGDPREPVHIHVMKGGAEAKFWVEPVVIARSSGFDAKTLRSVSMIVADNAHRIKEAWNDHFSD